VSVPEAGRNEVINEGQRFFCPGMSVKREAAPGEFEPLKKAKVELSSTLPSPEEKEVRYFNVLLGGTCVLCVRVCVGDNIIRRICPFAGAVPQKKSKLNHGRKSQKKRT
jgi:hypothetical protein